MSIVNRPRGVRPFRLASVNPQIWLDCESHRPALSSGGSATLFQDAAGTSVVTAVEQPVGRSVDQSGNSRHALQATSTARPLLTARKNLGIRTNTFFNSANSYTPGAYGTLARITKTSSGVSYAQSETQSTFVADTTITVSIRVKWDGHNIPDFSLEYNNANNFGTAFVARWNVTSAGVSLVAQSACTASTVAEADGVYRLSATFVTGASVAITAGTNPTVLHKMQGVSGATILAGDFQIEYGASATGYQRVISSTGYDITAAPLVMRFDGADDVLAASFAPGTLPASADVYVVLNRDPDDGSSAIGIDLSAGGRVFGIMSAGDPSLAFSGCGSPTATVNGVTVPGGTAINRSQLHTAVGVAEPRILEIRGADLSVWGQFATVSSQWAAMAFKGRIGAILIAPAQSDGTRTKIRKALAKAYQIQGVV